MYEVCDVVGMGALKNLHSVANEHIDCCVLRGLKHFP